MLVQPISEVRLLSNVPLTSNYEHQMDFASSSAQASYFLGKSSHTFLDFTYVRQDEAIKIPKGVDSIYNCNYVMYRNPEFSSKWFYAFITKKEYVNPDTAKIYIQTDVFQTWQFDFDWKPSYIVREHQKRFNADGTPIVNTVDEGLDYGSKYEITKVTNYQPYLGIYFLVAVCTQRMDTSSKDITPFLNGSPQPLTYYIHPFRLDGSSPTSIIGGQTVAISKLSDVMKGLYKQEGAVNNLVSLYVTEYFGVDLTYEGGTMTFPTGFEHVTIQDTDESFNTIRVAEIKAYEKHETFFGGKFEGFEVETESKLYMHPYCVTILTDMKGNQQEIKHEYINQTELAIEVRGSLGVSNKVSYSVQNYLYSSNVVEADKIGIENGIINNNPNDLPIITDMLSAYLQGNRNQLENQKNSIMFNGVANTVGNIFGGIGSALSRNPIGVVGAAAGIATGAASTYFQIQGLQAKQKDIDTMPPQLNRMGGNTAFDYGNGYNGVYIVKKQITEEYRKKLRDFFMLYGYKCSELKVPDVKSRTHWNYIQTQGANLVGDIPHEDMMQLKAMFDNGVTLWHGDWVLDYTKSNIEG